jgi:hypothetical protein
MVSSASSSSEGHAPMGSTANISMEIAPILEGCPQIMNQDRPGAFRQSDCGPCKSIPVGMQVDNNNNETANKSPIIIDENSDERQIKISIKEKKSKLEGE